MKKFFALTTALFLTTTAAFAQELSFVGNTEYAFESEVFEMNAGIQYDVDNWSLVALANTDNVNNDFSFTGFELAAFYTLNENVDLYAIVETDGDVNYEETTVGAAFKF